MDAAETGRRVKAAIGYGLLDRKAAAGALGVSVSGLNRVYNAKTAVGDDALERLAGLAGLPFSFFTIDFASGANYDADLDRRLRQVEARMAVLEAEARQQTGDTGRASEGPPQ
jgi:transcriptional regulator with XRE-family HTH domain